MELTAAVALDSFRGKFQPAALGIEVARVLPGAGAVELRGVYRWDGEGVASDEMCSRLQFGIMGCSRTYPRGGRNERRSG